MRYYKMVNDLGWSNFKNGIIYKENFTTQDGLVVGSLATIGLNPQDWQEVSKREYWQQELDAGRLVKGGYYVNSNQVIHKHSGTKDAEYYLNWKQNIFYRNRGNFNTIQENGFYRLATDDEIEWLEVCNKAGRFISKEEFMKSKEFVLKENMKDRKVDYYKLIKPEFTKAAEVIMETSFGYREGVGVVKVPLCITRLEKAGVLNLWFEPVYEPELKVGDWVIVTKEFSGNPAKVGHICQLVKIDNSDIPYKIQDTYKNYNWGVKTSWVEDVRLATPEEIKNATVIKIKGYEAKIDAQEGKVKIGCKSFTYGNVRGVVAAIEAGLQIEDADQILKLWDKIK